MKAGQCRGNQQHAWCVPEAMRRSCGPGKKMEGEVGKGGPVAMIRTWLLL